MATFESDAGALMAEGTDPRRVVMDRLKELGKSKYWLAQAVQEHISPNAVYTFLRGASDMKGASLAHLFAALDLKIYGAPPPKARRR